VACSIGKGRERTIPLAVHDAVDRLQMIFEGVVAGRDQRALCSSNQDPHNKPTSSP
jgi:hypothetical protein